MWYCNQGNFTVRGVELTKEIRDRIVLIFETSDWKMHFEPCEIFLYPGDDGKEIVEKGFTVSFEELFHDLEYVFPQLEAYLKDELHAELHACNVICFGDADGEYVLRNGKIEFITNEEIMLRDAAVQDLIDSLKEKVEETGLAPELEEFAHWLLSLQDDIIDARFVSVWDGGFEVNTACKVNLATKEVFDVEVSEDTADLVNELDEEYIIIDGQKYPVVAKEYMDNDPEEEGSYWYE